MSGAGSLCPPAPLPLSGRTLVNHRSIKRSVALEGGAARRPGRYRKKDFLYTLAMTLPRRVSRGPREGTRLGPSTRLFAKATKWYLSGGYLMSAREFDSAVTYS